MKATQTINKISRNKYTTGRALTFNISHLTLNSVSTQIKTFDKENIVTHEKLNISYNTNVKYIQEILDKTVNQSTGKLFQTQTQIFEPNSTKLMTYIAEKTTTILLNDTTKLPELFTSLGIIKNETDKTTEIIVNRNQTNKSIENNYKKGILKL